MDSEKNPNHPPTGEKGPDRQMGNMGKEAWARVTDNEAPHPHIVLSCTFNIQL